MCGRFTLTRSADEVARAFGPDVEVQLPEPLRRPRYNIAPGQDAAVLEPAARVPGRVLRPRRFGLVPGWARDPRVGHRLINARAETVARKPAFRAAFRRSRCLVPADGFYEWQRREGGPRQPYHVRLRGGEVFAMAGLAERWQGEDGAVLETFAILTTDAPQPLASIHDRMPVILPRELHAVWLDRELRDSESLLPLLRPLPPEWIEFRPVSRWVNTPTHDDPRCLAPPESDAQIGLDLGS